MAEAGNFFAAEELAATGETKGTEEVAKRMAMIAAIDSEEVEGLEEIRKRITAKFASIASESAPATVSSGLVIPAPTGEDVLKKPTASTPASAGVPLTFGKKKQKKKRPRGRDRTLPLFKTLQIGDLVEVR